MSTKGTKGTFYRSRKHVDKDCAEVLEMAEKGKLVRKGYDRIAEEYQADRYTLDNRKELEEFAGFLPKNAKVLDAGCGAGIPAAKFLIDSEFEVVGIDFSETMLKLARKNVPEQHSSEKTCPNWTLKKILLTA
jgi:ubiquinone/menaquinone biosynthesis C-methylase UbiE